MSAFDNATLMITGGTGSFGSTGGRKIFCVYGKNSSLIRNRYV